MTLPLLKGRIRVVFSEYLPKRTRVRFPKKGPYYQRRMRRSEADPNNWSKPNVFMMNGNTLVVRPSDWPLVKQLLGVSADGVLCGTNTR